MNDKNYPQVEIDLVHAEYGTKDQKAGCKYRIRYTESKGNSTCGIGDTVERAVIDLIDNFRSLYGYVFPFERHYEDGKYFFHFVHILKSKDLQGTMGKTDPVMLDKWVRDNWECITNILKDSIVHDPDTFIDIISECSKRDTEEGE